MSVTVLIFSSNIITWRSWLAGWSFTVGYSWYPLRKARGLATIITAVKGFSQTV